VRGMVRYLAAQGVTRCIEVGRALFTGCQHR
jgi:hypothetical protein